MKKSLVFICMAFLALVAGWHLVDGVSADDTSVDRHIQDLKKDDPAVRAKAAYELGCG
jgi:hypothetical protein